MKIINDLLDFKGLKIVQDTSFFKFSIDSVLLADFIKVKNNRAKVIDLCSGNVPIPLILSTKIPNKILAVELQSEVVALAIESVKLNKISTIEVINDNINNLKKRFNHKYFDVISCNPPYFKYNDNSNTNNNNIKTIARHEKHINLEEVFDIVKYLLSETGSFFMVHRTERLQEIINVASANGLFIKKLQFIYSHINDDATAMLIEFRKNSKIGANVLKSIVLHDSDGNYLEGIKNKFK